MTSTMRTHLSEIVPAFARGRKYVIPPKSNVDIPLAMAVSATFKRYDAENPDLSVDDILAMTASTHDINRSEVIELLWGMTNQGAVVAATSPTREN